MMGCMIHASLALFAGSAICAVGSSITVQSRTDMPLPRLAQLVTRALMPQLTAVVIEDTAWTEGEVLRGITGALTILGQCGLGANRLTLLRIRAPVAFHDLSTRESRRLAAALDAPRPTLFFVRDTRNRPAFDAEAFGSQNTRLRPELTHTVWITRQAPELAEAIAHELFHILADDGSHSDDTANLMHDRTAPGRRVLNSQQCAKMLEAGRNAGLLSEQ